MSALTLERAAALVADRGELSPRFTQEEVSSEKDYRLRDILERRLRAEIDFIRLVAPYAVVNGRETHWFRRMDSRDGRAELQALVDIINSTNNEYDVARAQIAERVRARAELESRVAIAERVVMRELVAQHVVTNSDRETLAQFERFAQADGWPEVAAKAREALQESTAHA